MILHNTLSSIFWLKILAVFPFISNSLKTNFFQEKKTVKPLIKLVFEYYSHTLRSRLEEKKLSVAVLFYFLILISYDIFNKITFIAIFPVIKIIHLSWQKTWKIQKIKTIYEPNIQRTTVKFHWRRSHSTYIATDRAYVSSPKFIYWIMRESSL